MTFQYQGESLKIDELFKSLVFRAIMDHKNLTKNEREVLFVVLRQTLHFQKWSDSISLHFMSKSAMLSEKPLRKAIKQLEEKNFLEIEHSQGGKNGKNRLNVYSFSDAFLTPIAAKTVAIKSG